MKPFKFFHDQHENETCYGSFRKHWTQLILPFSRFILMNMAIFIAILIDRFFLEVHTLSHIYFDLIILFLFLFSLYETYKFYLSILSWLLTVIIITDYRIIEVYKTIFLHDEKEGIDLKKVQDVQMKKKGFWQNLLDYP